MEKIENSSGNILFKLKLVLIDFLRDKCFKFRNFLNRFTKDMCFTKKELEEIKKRVEKTKESEVKFDYFEQNLAPKVKDLIENLKKEKEVLELEKQFCLDGIRNIYLADRDGNEEMKKELFAKFGLPFVLKIDKK